MTQSITRDQILARLQANEPLVLVEALPPQYFNKEHLPGAININHDQIAALAPTLLPDKNAFIVTYCSNPQCNNSTLAAHQLAQLGYRNVFKYAGGKQDWLDAGLLLERADSAVAV